MKKIVVAIILGIIVGTIIGINTGLHAPKWVREEPGYYIVCTKFLGHVFEDGADKESHHIDSCYSYATMWR